MERDDPTCIHCGARVALCPAGGVFIAREIMEALFSMDRCEVGGSHIKAHCAKAIRVNS